MRIPTINATLVWKHARKHATRSTQETQNKEGGGGKAGGDKAEWGRGSGRGVRGGNDNTRPSSCSGLLAAVARHDLARGKIAGIDTVLEEGRATGTRVGTPPWDVCVTGPRNKM